MSGCLLRIGATIDVLSGVAETPRMTAATDWSITDRSRVGRQQFVKLTPPMTLFAERLRRNGHGIHIRIETR